MSYDFLNSIGNAFGQGIGQVGNGLSYMGDTMSSAYDRTSGFDAFGLGSGLRSGMADAGLGQNAIDNMMSAGKWGLGMGAAGAMLGGGQGAMQGMGMGLLGGGLGSYLQHKGQKPKGLLSSLDEESKLSPSERLMKMGNGLMNQNAAITPQFQGPQAPALMGSAWQPLDAYRRVGMI